jgi:MFS transporter, Spinster family, sphingosine-1-phosphate transporter
VLVAGSRPVESASGSPPSPVAATPAAETEEPKQEEAAAAAAAGVQAMAVTVVRDVETGLDASTSDRDGDAGDNPSWFTPKR